MIDQNLNTIALCTSTQPGTLKAALIDFLIKHRGSQLLSYSIGQSTDTYQTAVQLEVWLKEETVLDILNLLVAQYDAAKPKEETQPMTEHYTPEESQLLVELAVVLASFAGTQLLEEDFPVIGEPSYLQDKYLRQAQAVLKVVQRNKAALTQNHED